MWTNLIDNAVAAMDGAWHADRPHLALDDDSLIVEICDTGTGIAPDIQGRIFDQFFTTKPVGEGTGLGLDISWRIVVNKHHGDLTVIVGARRHPVPGAPAAHRAEREADRTTVRLDDRSTAG